MTSACKKINNQFSVMTRFGKIPFTEAVLLSYKVFILPHFYYCSMVWHSCSRRNSDKLDLLNKRILNNYWTRLSKISWFVSGEQINYLPMPKASGNNWSARHWQITIFWEIEFNNCFIIQQDNVFMHLTSTLASQLFIPTPSARFHFVQNFIFCTKNTKLVNSAFANN